jgi:predicted nucleotidyltransferase
VDSDALANALRDRLANEVGVVAAWLFGSRARGTAKASSDVDVCVLFGGERSLDDLLDLQAELSRVVGAGVDLVAARGAPPDLFHRVLRDGVLIVENDRSARVAFEVEMRNRYFDMTPIWLEYRRARGAAG